MKVVHESNTGRYLVQVVDRSFGPTDLWSDVASFDSLEKAKSTSDFNAKSNYVKCRVVDTQKGGV